MSLKKLAYYGYVEEYAQEALGTMKYYPLKEQFISLVSKKRNDETTKELQQDLITYFTRCTYSTNEFNSWNYIYTFTSYNDKKIFGASWANILQWQEIPALDPQDDALIQATLKQLVVPVGEHSNYPFISSSLFVRKAVEFYVGKAKEERQGFLYKFLGVTNALKNAHHYLKMALELDPECDKVYLTDYIDFHIEKSEYKQAYGLMKQLPILDDAVYYLLNKFPKKQRLALVDKDSPLAKKLASALLQKNEVEEASYYVSDLAALSPEQTFILWLSKGEFDNAYELFIRNEKPQWFNKQARQQLADHFSKEGEHLYDEGSELRKTLSPTSSSEHWTKAKHLYAQSMVAKKKAYDLTLSNEDKEQMDIHKRLYAQLLIDADTALQKATTVDVASMQRAVGLLDQCQPVEKDEKKHHLRAQVKGLMRQVEHLTHLIKVPALYSRDRRAFKSHIEEHQENFESIQRLLERVISLLKNTKKPELRLVLGKAHFIMGDMALFFDLEIEYKVHFKNAIEAVPDNPYYVLRGSEHFEQKKNTWQKKGLSLLKKLGHQATDYIHWDEERWNQGEPVYGTIHSIHAEPEPKKTTSFLSRIMA